MRYVRAAGIRQSGKVIAVVQIYRRFLRHILAQGGAAYTEAAVLSQRFRQICRNEALPGGGAR
ncbi:MAG: hypothetical protein ACREFQ_08645 [Stellaceae bacterium]